MRFLIASARRSTLLGLALIVLVTTVLATGVAFARCDRVIAGCDNCTVCQRWVAVGGYICYENYYYCINTCTGQMDGGYNDTRCTPI